jgi:hypothetical protein
MDALKRNGFCRHGGLPTEAGGGGGGGRGAGGGREEEEEEERLDW